MYYSKIGNVYTCATENERLTLADELREENYLISEYFDITIGRYRIRVTGQKPAIK